MSWFLPEEELQAKLQASQRGKQENPPDSSTLTEKQSLQTPSPPCRAQRTAVLLLFGLDVKVHAYLALRPHPQ